MTSKSEKASGLFRSFHSGYLFPLLIVLILGVTYFMSMAPGLTWAHFSADGGDLISAAVTGGIPHPSGYPLYLLLARAFQILPIGNLAFRTNLLSAVCTILTVLLLYQYLLRQLGDRHLARFVSFLAAIAYGLAPLVWGQALVTEVYALHGLLIILCIHILSQRGSRISEWIRGFVFGIAATNHLTAVLMFPLLLLGHDERLFVPTSVLLKRGLGLVGGLALYLSLPIRAYFDPPINWGDASTLDGFFWLVSGRLYHSYAFSLPWMDMFQRMRAVAGFLLDQFTWPGVVLGIYGLLLPSSRRSLIPVSWMGAAFLLFAVVYGSSDSQVNLLPLWLAFAVWMAHGLQDALEWIHESPKIQKAILGILFIALWIRIPSLFTAVDASRDIRAQNFINNAIQTIPRGFLVFVDGDAQLFALWYVQFARQQRTDLVILAEGLLPYEWYVENLQSTYKNLNLPQKAELEIDDLVTANPGRGICYISHDEPIVCMHNP